MLKLPENSFQYSTCSVLPTFESRAILYRRLLRKASLELKTAPRWYQCLQDFLDQNQDLFMTDFDSLSAAISSLLAEREQSCRQREFRSPVSRWVARRAPCLEKMLAEKTFDCLFDLLYALSKIKGLHIKLVELSSNSITVQRFGSKSQPVIRIVRIENLLGFARSVESPGLRSFEFQNGTRNVSCFERKPSVASCCKPRVIKPDRESWSDNETSLDLGLSADYPKAMRKEFFNDVLDASDQSSNEKEELVACSPQNKTPVRQKALFTAMSADTHLQRPSEDLSCIGSQPFSNSLTSGPHQAINPASHAVFAESWPRTGVIKFYCEENQFGFITTESGEEVYFNYQDLVKASIDTRTLSHLSQMGYQIAVAYRLMHYASKGKTHKKAANMNLLGFSPATTK